MELLNVNQLSLYFYLKLTKFHTNAKYSKIYWFSGPYTWYFHFFLSFEDSKVSSSPKKTFQNSWPSTAGMSNWRPLCLFCSARIGILIILQINYFDFLPIISLCLPIFTILSIKTWYKTYIKAFSIITFCKIWPTLDFLSNFAAL